jgi:hypothetical protein
MGWEEHDLVAHADRTRVDCMSCIFVGGIILSLGTIIYLKIEYV